MWDLANEPENLNLVAGDALGLRAPPQVNHISDG
jgi:hypothetical protein